LAVEPAHRRSSSAAWADFPGDPLTHAFLHPRNRLSWVLQSWQPSVQAVDTATSGLPSTEANNPKPRPGPRRSSQEWGAGETGGISRVTPTVRSAPRGDAGSRPRRPCPWPSRGPVRGARPPTGLPLCSTPGLRRPGNDERVPRQHPMNPAASNRLRSSRRPHPAAEHPAAGSP
jgi:hypothetical protein